MKKICCLLVILFCLTLVTGCSNNKSPAGKDGDTSSSTNTGEGAASDKIIELDMYFPVAVGGGPDAIITELCEQFYSEHPNIKVKPVYSGTYAETRTKVQAAIQGGNTPAIALMFSIDLFSLLSMDVIHDYESFSTTEEDQEWLNGFYEGFMMNSQTGGKTYGIPWQRSTIILYYNKDAFTEVGLDPEVPPETWEELEEYASKLTREENGTITRYGIQIPSDTAGYAYWMLQTFCNQQNGFNLMNQDGNEVYFNDPKTVKGLSFWKSLSDKGYQPPTVTAWSTTPTDFLEEKAAMIYHTTGNLTNIKNNASFDFGTAMLPANESKGSPTGGGNFYLFKGVPEEQTQAAYTFIKWMTNDPERVAQWSIDTGYVATRPEAYETDIMKNYVKDFPQALVARDQLEHGYAEFSVYDQGNVQKALDDAIELVMSGQKDVQDALDEAQTKADEILKPYKQ
jgi:sn-glycerol 3-phosphate transport system substrate-binding protein